MRSNISVGLPIDLLIYERDSLKIGYRHHIDETDPYFNMIHSRWGEGLRKVFTELPNPDWNVANRRLTAGQSGAPRLEHPRRAASPDPLPLRPRRRLCRRMKYACARHRTAARPSCRYSLNVEPEEHFINWQQDVFGNYIARFVFPEKTRELEITVDLVADMTVINPFDFFIESYAENFPFAYRPELARDLTPYLALDRTRAAAASNGWPISARAHPGRDRHHRFPGRRQPAVAARHPLPGAHGTRRADAANKRCSTRAAPAATAAGCWCRSCATCGLAARFVSGYLIQLKADQKPLDGPPGTERDFTDLHAWAEAYIPGAGWVGLDPTSGLLAGEGHIPLACTPSPRSAAPVSGGHRPLRNAVRFRHDRHAHP